MGKDISSISQVGAFKSLGKTLKKGKDQDYVSSSGADIVAPKYKLGYRTKSEKKAFDQLSDEVRYYKFDGSQKISERSEVAKHPKMLIGETMNRAALQLARASAGSQFAAARSKYAGSQMPNELSFQAEADALNHFKSKLDDEVTTLVDALFGDRENLTGIERPTVGKVKSIVPDVDNLVKKMVQEFMHGLIADLAAGPKSQAQELIEKLIVVTVDGGVPPRAGDIDKSALDEAASAAIETRVAEPSLGPESGVPNNVPEERQSGLRSLIPRSDLEAASEALRNFGAGSQVEHMIPLGDLEAASRALRNFGAGSQVERMIPLSDLEAASEALGNFGAGPQVERMTPPGDLNAVSEALENIDLSPRPDPLVPHGDLDAASKALKRFS